MTMTAAAFRREMGARLAALPAVLVAPFTPSGGPMTVRTSEAMVAVAKLDIRPAETAKPRGLRLRDKGEAFGGGTPDRVDKSTDTLAAQ